MSGQEEIGSSSDSQKAPPTPGCRSLAKRALFIPLVTIIFILVYIVAFVAIQPQQMDDSVIDTSDEHVAILLKEWKDGKKSDNGLKLENKTKEKLSKKIPNTIDGEASLNKGYRYRSPKWIEHQRERKDLKIKYDNETQKMAKFTSGKPKYSEYDLSQLPTKIDPNAFDCVQLKVVPRTPICLYDSKEDVFVSKQIRELGIWEEHIVAQFQKVLTKDHTLGVIDIGANIGQYSLIAANMGHDVLAVEPWEASLERFKTATNMAGLRNKITVLKNAVSDKRSRICLKSWADNQGNVHIDSQSETYNNRINCNYTYSIYLDDLLQFVTFKRAVIKMDIQGFEHRAFLHAKNLLREVFIPYIFMEWVMMREFWMTSSHESLDKAIVRYLVDLLTDLEYRVFSLVSRKELDTRYWFGWPEDVVWIHKSQIIANKNPIEN